MIFAPKAKGDPLAHPWAVNGLNIKRLYSIQAKLFDIVRVGPYERARGVLETRMTSSMAHGVYAGVQEAVRRRRMGKP